MKVNGPKKLVKRVVSAAVSLDLYEFELTVKWGEDSWLEEDAPGVFTMSIDSTLKKWYLMEAVAHEMVHVRQYLRKDIADMPDGKTLWRGELYDTPETGTDAYYLCPWEIEARGLQEWLVLKWEARKRELH